MILMDDMELKCTAEIFSCGDFQRDVFSCIIPRSRGEKTEVVLKGIFPRYLRIGKMVRLNNLYWTTEQSSHIMDLNVHSLSLDEKSFSILNSPSNNFTYRASYGTKKRVLLGEDKFEVTYSPEMFAVIKEVSNKKIVLEKTSRVYVSIPLVCETWNINGEEFSCFLSKFGKLLILEGFDFIPSFILKATDLHIEGKVYILKLISNNRIVAETSCDYLL